MSALLQGCYHILCCSLGLSLFKLFLVYRLNSLLFMLSVFMQAIAQDYFSVHSYKFLHQLVFIWFCIFKVTIIQYSCMWYQILLFNSVLVRLKKMFSQRQASQQALMVFQHLCFWGVPVLLLGPFNLLGIQSCYST